MSGRPDSPKSRLILTAADLIYKQGWNATGINQILTHADVPKGSFYYYFESKEDLGVAIVRHWDEDLRERYKKTLRNEGLCGRLAIEAFFEDQFEFQRSTEWRYGCPVGNFSNEVAASDDDGRIAAVCREAVDELVRALTDAIARGQTDGSLRKDGAAATLALYVASLWQGSLLITKTLRREAPSVAAVQGIARTLYAGSLSNL